jgi:putative DNA primase/helicase
MGAATLAPIVRALGGDLMAGGRRANVPGPGHSPADRSVSLWLVGGRVVVHCFAGDDWRDVLADLRRRKLVDGDGRLTNVRHAEPTSDDRPHRAARVAAARALWAEGRPLAGTLSAQHLAWRDVDAGGVEALRHHPAAPAAVYAARGPRRPAVLAAIRDPAGVLVGVELTYLALNGERARLAVPRKTIGTCPPGAAVRLAPAGAALLVGEGVFTCLSAGAHFGLPAWALLSTRNLRAWTPPAGVRAVLLAADRGADGERSAQVLAERLRAMGIACAVRFPPAPYGDWNEALCGRPERERGRDRVARRTGGPGRRPGDPAMTHDDGLVLIPAALRPVLVANGARDGDHVPVLKLFNPAGPGTWLITELGDDGDTLFGLCDLDMGCPELGSVSLSEITSVTLPFGLTIERDVSFEGRVPISRWTELARSAGSIREAEAAVRALPAINGTPTG